MPNQEHIIDKIKILTVKITLNIQDNMEIGTGVILYIEENFYILTVHHTIYGKDGNYNTKAENLTIESSSGQKLIVNEIEDLNSLVLLSIDNIDFELPKVFILDKAYYDQSYFLRGYPEAVNGGVNSHPFNDVSCDERNAKNITLNIKNMNDDSSGIDAIDNINGMSGSGVFFEQFGKLFLVGCVNELLNSSGVFNGAVANTLIDLNFSKLEDIEFTTFKTIDNITKEIEEKNNKIGEGEFDKFKAKENQNFNNLNRKHEAIFHPNTVVEKNLLRIEHYVNGQTIINEFASIDTNFKQKWLNLLNSMLEYIKVQYDEYIDSKSIGSSRISELVSYIKDSIINEFKYLLDENTILLHSLTNYVIAKWLLDCNVNFIIDEGM